MAWSPAYVTDEEFGEYLGSASTVDTAPIRAVAIEAASRVIDQATNRQFGKVDEAEARLYTARYDRRRCAYVVDIDDLSDSDGVTVTVNGTAVTDFTLRPYNKLPYTKLISATINSTEEGAVSVTGVWGWPAVPDTIKQACLIQAHRFFKRQGAEFGIAGSPDMGNELRLLSKVDPDVAVMLAAYARHWGAV
jgi:hypothetical protein